MQHFYLRLALAGAFAGGSALAPAAAQSLVSGFMSGRGHGSISLSATTESYDKAFLVPEKVDGIPVFRRIQINSVSLYASYGISKNIEAVATLPYIRSAGQADTRALNSLGLSSATNVRGNLQDVTALLKFKSYSREIGSTILDLLGSVGVSTPVGNYRSDPTIDYIVAIGNRATKLNVVGVAHLKTASGVFVTGQTGYSWRSARVPNAFLAEGKVGYAGRRIYLESFANFQVSAASGTDILQPGFDGDFTATRVNFSRVGITAFRPLAQGLGVTLGASRYISGRNIGESTAFSAGLAYSF